MKCPSCNLVFKSFGKPYFKHLQKHNNITNLANCSANINPSLFYLDEIKNLPANYFSVLSLNINSICKKTNKGQTFFDVTKEVEEILNTKKIDFCLFQETKLDGEVPISFFKNSAYKPFRCDRNRAGGGSILFVKKEYTINKIQTFSPICDLEFIYIQLKLNKRLVNFICTYKPPKDNNTLFISKLE